MLNAPIQTSLALKDRLCWAVMRTSTKGPAIPRDCGQPANIQCCLLHAILPHCLSSFVRGLPRIKLIGRSSLAAYSSWLFFRPFEAPTRLRWLSRLAETCLRASCSEALQHSASSSRRAQVGEGKSKHRLLLHQCDQMQLACTGLAASAALDALSYRTAQQRARP